MRALVIALWIGVAAIVAYWTIWFAIDRDWLASLHTPAYYVFENAFPLADGWLVVTAAAAAITLRANRPSAAFWLIAAGSAGVYLAGMDVLFDLQNGVYSAPDHAAVATELVINLCSLGLGVWALAAGWRLSSTRRRDNA
ncbi:MAG: hypothetical protein ABI678_15145 [Kofleriaceae bacterium]